MGYWNFLGSGTWAPYGFRGQRNRSDPLPCQMSSTVSKPGAVCSPSHSSECVVRGLLWCVAQLYFLLRVLSLSCSDLTVSTCQLLATKTCRLRNCKYGPASFPGQWPDVVKSDLTGFLYLGMFSNVLLIRAPFYVLLILVGMCSVFWLFWLSCHYLPSDRLERILWGSPVVTRGSSPQSPAWRGFMIFLVCCIASLFMFVLSPTIDFILSWHDIACLYWKCR